MLPSFSGPAIAAASGKHGDSLLVRVLAALLRMWRTENNQDFWRVKRTTYDTARRFLIANRSVRQQCHSGRMPASSVMPMKIRHTLATWVMLCAACLLALAGWIGGPEWINETLETEHAWRMKSRRLHDRVTERN